MKSTALTLNGAPVLGKFGKGLNGARSLSFGTSGGRNCNPGCAYHPRSTSAHAAPDDRRCYAHTVENSARRPQLLAKLQRHESLDPCAVLERAAGQLDRHGWRIPWFRFCTFGAMPEPVDCTPEFVLLLRWFIGKLRAVGTPVHLPVETARKATHYRRILAGIDVIVRESCGSPRRWRTAPVACSFVAGSMQSTPRERIAEAKRTARLRAAATGRIVKVCPAVSSQHLNTKSTAAKCGGCTLCAEDVDIVYPVHA